MNAIHLDMMTAVSIYIFVCYLCTFLLSISWISTRKYFQGVGLFSVALLMQSLGMTLAVFRPSVPVFFSVFLANAAIFMCLLAVLAGITIFIGKKPNSRRYAIYFAVFSVFYFTYSIIIPDIRARIIIFSTASSAIFLEAVYTIFWKADKNHFRYGKLAAYVCSGLAAISIFRLFSGIFSDTIQNYFTSPTSDVFYVTMHLLFTVALTYSLNIMIMKKLLHNSEISMEQQTVLLKQMEKMAILDSLTDTFNRRKLEEELTAAIEYSKRYNQPLSVCMCDIDNFKAINDTYGHDAGDRAIVKVASTLRASLRSVDVLGRWGGEEFFIVCPGLRMDQCAALAERLRSVISDADDRSDSPAQLTVSFGVAEFDAALSGEELVKRTDRALYSAKGKGKNRVEQWDSRLAAP